jgi:prophage antirepressor-like protein
MEVFMSEVITTTVSSVEIPTLDEQLPATAPAAIKLFEDKGFKVRVIMRAGNPWFVAKDACDCLTISNVTQACQTLDEDEKGVCKVETLGGKQDMMVISESGLYTLIMRSNKEQAKPFRRWVTGEVLPSIRKTGGYSVAQPPIPSYMLESEEERAIAWAEEHRQARLALEAKDREIEALGAERDEAIRTKAMIGSKREATAMATASAKSKECARLTTENDLLKQDFVTNGVFCSQLLAQNLVVYAESTLKAKCSKALQELTALMEKPTLDWKEWNDKAGKEVPRVAYHKDVCTELKQRIIDNPKYLKRF